MPIGSRSSTTTRIVDGKMRRTLRVGHPRRAPETLPPGLQIDRQDAHAVSPSSTADDLAARHARVAVDADVPDRQRAGGQDQTGRLIEGGDDRDHREDAARSTAIRDERAGPAGRRHVRAAEALVRRDRYAHAASSSARSRRLATVPIEPAPSVSTASPGLACAASIGTSSSRVLHHRHRPQRAPPDRLGQRVGRDAGDRVLAGRVDLGQHHFVGLRERVAERFHQARRPRVAVRLERHHQAPVERHPRRRQHRGDLGRVVAVVVHHQHAACFADALKPPLRAVEALRAPRPPGRTPRPGTRPRPRPPARSGGCGGPAPATWMRPSRCSTPSRRTTTVQRPPNAPELDVLARDGGSVVQTVGDQPPRHARQDGRRSAGSSAHATTLP